MVSLYEKRIILFISFLLLISGPISADMFLPALPAIQDYFSVTTSFIELTVPIYFIAFGLAQFGFGYISDLHGRKKIIILGIFISALGSLCCYKASNPLFFMGGRVMQGIGLGASTGLVRAVWKDLYIDTQLLKINSLATSLNAILLLILPLVGGVIHYFYAWQTIFFSIFCLNLFCLFIAFFFIKESSAELAEDTFQEKFFRYNLNLISNIDFLFYSVMAAISFGLVILFITEAPIIIQRELGFSSLEYGQKLIFPISGLIVSGVLNSILAPKYNSNVLFKTGVFLALFFSTMLNLFQYYPILNGEFIIYLMSFAMFSLGLILSNSFPLAMKTIEKMYGTSSSLYGVIQLVGTSLFLFLVTNLFVTSLHNFLVIFFGMSVLLNMMILIFSNYLSINSRVVWK